MKFPKITYNLIFSDGGLGDQIGRLVVVKWLKEHQSHATPIVWVPDYFLRLGRHLLPNTVIKSYTEGLTKYDAKLPGRKTGCEHHSTLKTHIVDHAFHVLADTHEKDETQKNYLKLRLNEIDIRSFKLPQKYVVMTTGYTAPIREFLPQYINEIVVYIKSRGYEVVFLGNTDVKPGAGVLDIKGNFKEDIDYSQGINLIDKTDLLEAGKIMANAKAVVGLDNGLLHLAACSDVSIVGGFTSVDPKHRLPTRHNVFGWNYYPVVPPDSEPEKFFQSRHDLIFDYDFKFSYNNHNNLIKSVSADKYIAFLKDIL